VKRPDSDLDQATLQCPDYQEIRPMTIDRQFQDHPTNWFCCVVTLADGHLASPKAGGKTPERSQHDFMRPAGRAGCDNSTQLEIQKHRNEASMILCVLPVALAVDTRPRSK
jgi:hypothetical protein